MGANTKRMNENGATRVRCLPYNGKDLVRDPDNAQAPLNLEGMVSITATVLAGSNAVKLYNADGSPVGLSGAVKPHRYGEFWVVGQSVQEDTEVRIMVTATGPAVVGQDNSRDFSLIVANNVVEQPDLPEVTRVEPALVVFSVVPDVIAQ